MKRFLFLLCAAAMMCVGCETDIITDTDITPITDDDDNDNGGDTNSTTATVTIVFGNPSATVDGTSATITAAVDGNQVTITNAGNTVVRYELSGSTANGFFKLYSSKKQTIVLNGVSITNPNGAAINIQGPANSPNSGKKATVIVQGDNALADGTSYSDTPAAEDEKAAFFSEGKLEFSGTGTLTVTAQGKSGIASDDYVYINGPTISVNSSAGHGIRGKDYIEVDSGTVNVTVSANMKKGFSADSLVRINGGNITIQVSGNAAYDSDDQEYTGTAGIKADELFVMNGGSVSITNSGTGGKGISCDGPCTFNGGTVTVATTGSNHTTGDISSKGIECDGNLTFAGSKVFVTCRYHEGIESKGTITISDGEVYSYSQGDDAINTASDFTITGGYVYGQSTANDGLDANGNCYIRGGVVYAIGKQSPELAIDANTEGGRKLYVEGGTIIAIGGLERGASLTQSCYQTSTWSKNTWYALTVGTTTYAFKTPSSGGTPMVVSGSTTPTLTSGVTVSGGTSYFDGLLYTDATVSGGSAVTLSNYTGGNGGGPGGGGGHGGH